LVPQPELIRLSFCLSFAHPTTYQQARIQQLQDDRQRDNAAATRAAADAATATVASQRAQLDALRAAVAERDAELGLLRAEAEDGARGRREREEKLAAELEEARWVDHQVLLGGSRRWLGCECGLGCAEGASSDDKINLLNPLDTLSQTSAPPSQPPTPTPTPPTPTDPRHRRQLADLEDIDARYRRVVDQNRALYNEVQDLRGSIRVFCRIRCGRGGLCEEAGVLVWGLGCVCAGGLRWDRRWA